MAPTKNVDEVNGPGQITLNNVIYQAVSHVGALRIHRSRVSKYDDLKGMPEFEYEKLHSMRKRMRLLRLHVGGLSNPEITCELFEVEYDKDNIVRLTSDNKTEKGNSQIPPRSLQATNDDVVKYEALSWCWGRESKDCGIRVQKGGSYYRLAVTHELILALKYLRDPHKARILWIDALCINQNNHEERNHQVQMMARIYNCAEQALIWLGEDNDSSNEAINFIQEIMKLENFDSISEKRENASKWQSLLLLMQRPWFSRRWVVQEIALSRAATLYCGSDSIPWKNFAVAVELFVEVETATHRLSEVMKKDEAFGHVPRWFEHVSELGASVLVQATGKVFRRDGADKMNPDQDPGTSPRRPGRLRKSKSMKKMEQGQTSIGPPSEPLPWAPQRPLLSLEYLVSNLTVFEASQPRDAVYSLLAIARDTSPFAELRTISQEGSDEAIIMSTVSSFLERKPFKVDYSRPYSDVCKDFIMFCIQGGGSEPTRALDILCRPWAPEPESESSATVVHKKPILYKHLQNREPLWISTGKPRKQDTGEKHGDGTKILRDDFRSLDKYFEESSTYEGFEGCVKPFLPKRPAKKKTPEPSKENRNDGADTSEPEDSGDDVDDEQDETEHDVDLPSWVSRVSGASFALFLHPGMHSLQRIGRMNADPLVGLPQDGHRNYSAAQNTRVDYTSDRRLRFQKRPGPPGSEEKAGHYSLYTEGFVLSKVEKVEEPSRLGAIPETWTKLGGWKNAVDGNTDPPAEFWRTLVADRGKDNRNPPYYYATACKESVKKGGLRGGSVDTGQLINSERNSIIAEFCRRVQAVIWNRCLIKTEAIRDSPAGILGLASKDVRKGDLVCILFGCTVPVILRKHKRKSEEDLEQEKMQNAIQSMKALMSTCEDACFRKLRYRKYLAKLDEVDRECWVHDVRAERDAVNKQMKDWKEKEEKSKKEKQVDDDEKQKRKVEAEERKKLSQQNRKQLLGKDNSRPLSRSVTIPTQPSSVPKDEKGGATADTDTGTGPETRKEAEAEEREKKQLEQKIKQDKENARKDDPYLYYKFIGEAYIHGMMDGEAVRYQINEGIPKRMFEMR